MDNIFIRTQRFYKQSDVAMKLILINVAVFLTVRLIFIAAKLFLADDSGLVNFLALPSSPSDFIVCPWTLLTYMFLHVDFIHILFNMLWLYWFGRIFLLFFNERHLGGMYILGGLAGGLFFIAAYNIFPYFRYETPHSLLMGASASVMAIVFAAAFYRKDYAINLLFIGRIKLIYLALFALLIDLLSVASGNAGGHIAHIGGALAGILFAVRYQKGHDLTAFINRLIDRCVNLFKHKPRIKTTYRRAETDMEYNARKQEEQRVIDAILDKLKRSGYDSLSSSEKKTLFNVSKK